MFTRLFRDERFCNRCNRVVTCRKPVGLSIVVLILLCLSPVGAFFLFSLVAVLAYHQHQTPQFAVFVTIGVTVLAVLGLLIVYLLWQDRLPWICTRCTSTDTRNQRNRD